MTPTRDERAAQGRAARGHAKRSDHARLVPDPDRPDPVAVLREQDRTRVRALVSLRYERMLESPLAFLRGSAAIMAGDLASTPVSGLRAQLCGDAHLSNFGGFAAPDRQLVFDVNDFDETLPGPWEWDVKRLVASLVATARGNGQSTSDGREVALAAGAEYRRAMRQFAELGRLEVWYARLEVGDMFGRWADSGTFATKRLDKTVARARRKDHLRALAKLTREEDGRLRIVSDPPLVVPVEELPASERGRWGEPDLADLVARYRRSLPAHRRRLLDGYSPVHLARKVVGVGSVGTRAWILLLVGEDNRDPLFLQVKEARASVLEPFTSPSSYKSHGRRVIEGQRLMQAATDLFLGWLTVPEGDDGEPHDYYVRQLWDAKGSAVVEAMGASQLAAYGSACAWTLARAHARSGDPVAIAAYLGKGDRFERAVATFGERYAEQSERDYEALAAAARSGAITGG